MRNGVISRLAAHLLHYGVNINVNIGVDAKNREIIRSIGLYGP